MTNRNQQRLGVPPQMPQMPQMQPSTQTPSYTAPTEFVDLPSGGEFYPEGHPLHGCDKLEIRFMTTKEEDILNNKSFLKENQAINRMIESIMVTPVAVDDLLPTDRNAIMMAARSSGYGSEYKTNIRCGNCGNVHQENFDLESLKEVSTPEHNESVWVENGLVNMVLPKTGLTVKIKPMFVSDEKGLSEAQRARQKNNLPETAVTDLLSTLLVDVNGNIDRMYINSVIAQLPALDARFIRKSYVKAMPQLKLETDVVCPACGATERRNMPFTADFFWPE